MNRLELLSIFLLLVVLTIVVIKSKWFDRLIDSLLRGTKSTSVRDLKADAERLNANTETVSQDLETQAAQIKRDKAALKQL